MCSPYTTDMTYQKLTNFNKKSNRQFKTFMVLHKIRQSCHIHILTLPQTRPDSIQTCIINHRNEKKHQTSEEETMGEVDPSFIQDQEHRPKLTPLEAEEIPLIDLGPLHATDTLVSKIRDACENWGFFQVINHGFPLETRQRAEEAARRFFALPMEEKRKVGRDEVKVLGYYDTEHTKNVRDWKEVFDFVQDDLIRVPVSTDPDEKEVIELHNQWPQYPPEFREACEEYAREANKLCHTLMELIALSLGLPAKRFHDFFKDQTSFIRLNHYPPCPVPHLALGVGRHKDSGALTVLAQGDVGGLEVKRKSDGEWIRVKPTPDAYIVNIGDIIQVWSNDRYESVDHRVVVNSEKERFTLPFFLMPAYYTMVQPLEELTSEQNPAKYKAYNWGRFLAARTSGNYKKLDVENLQICDFRILDSDLASA